VSVSAQFLVVFRGQFHEQNRTEQNRTEQNRTEQNRTEQNRTEQNRIRACLEYIKPTAEGLCGFCDLVYQGRAATPVFLRLNLLSIFSLYALTFAVDARAELLCVKNQAAISAKNTDLRGALFLTKSSKCPKGSSSVLDTERLKGPRGAVGPQGSAGAVNITQCRRVSGAANSSLGFAFSSIECNPGEFLLNWGYSTRTPENFSATSVYPMRLGMRYWIVGGQPSSIPCCADVEMSYESGLTSSYTLFVDGTCCPY
jgi:hypothetical protein